VAASGNPVRVWEAAWCAMSPPILVEGILTPDYRILASESC